MNTADVSQYKAANTSSSCTSTAYKQNDAANTSNSFTNPAVQTQV